MSQLVIGIPGPWKDRSEILHAVIKANTSIDKPRFLPVGGVIMETTTKTPFGFDIYEHDPGLMDSFARAGQRRFRDEELAAVGRHRHTVYIVCGEPFNSVPREDLQAARVLLDLGVLLLDAGGFAVKVEHAGIAHTADRWRHYAKRRNALSCYDAFVTMIGSREFNYTCGMHTFGLPDVSLTTDVSIEQAPFLMNGFNQNRLLEKPDLTDGNVFSISRSRGTRLEAL